MITNNLKKIVTFAGGLNNAYYWGYNQNFTLKNFDNTDTEFYKIDKPTTSDGDNMTRILSGLSGKATSKDLEYLTNRTGQGAFFRVGTGKSAETVDDYKLDTDVSENFELIGMSNDTINYGRVFTCLFKNISNTDIIINEVGLFMKMYGGDYPQYFNKSVCCLLARTVLETPITIKSGETQVLNYTLNV